MSASSKALRTGRWKKVRLAILARDAYTCYVCGGVADQVDHLQARASGGALFDSENLAAICGVCNRAKGAKGVFSERVSTPPAFIDSSLPKTRTKVLKSPFNDPQGAV